MLRPGVFAAALISVTVSACESTSNRPGVVGGGTPAGAVQLDAQSVDTLVRLGDFTLARGDAASAVAMYNRAHQAEPDAILPLMRLGVAFAQLGSYEESAGAYRAALAIEPVNPDAHRGLGNALVALNRPQEGLPNLETALAMSNDPRAYNSIGVALDMLGRHDNAQFYYRQGVELAPGDTDLTANLALSLALSNQFDEAIALMRGAAARPDATARHRQNLALILALANRTDEAIGVARQDLDEEAVDRNIAFYEYVRSLPDSGARAMAIGSGGSAAVQR